MTVFFYCFREREDILRIFEMFSGQRMMTSYIRIGGLALEPPRGWQQSGVGKFIDGFPSKVDEYEDLLDEQSDLDRPHQGRRLRSARGHAGSGRHRADASRRRRANGTSARTSRTPSYEKFDFDVPTRTENDVYARYQVRMEEMRQSARIVKQALEGMPAGPWQADAPHVVLPDREKMKTQMEALIYHFKIVTEGFRVPAGEVLSGDRIAARRDRLLRGERRHIQSLPRASCGRRASATCKSLPHDGGRHADRRCDRLHGQHGFRSRETTDR